MLEKIFGSAKGIFNIVTIVELVISLICVVFGLLCFTNSNYSDTLVSVLVGILLIINGASCIYSFLKRGSIVLFNNNLIFGISSIIVGALALFLKNILSILLGIYLLVIGAQKITYGILLKKFHESAWLITLIIGILLSIIAIVSFFTNKGELVKISGIILFGYGLMNFINVILLRKRSIYFLI